MSVKEAEEEARKLLKTTWIPRPLPVDPFVLANELGIDVNFVRLPDDESGRIEISPDETPKISINMNDGENRQRFTCAHEIGHYLSRSDYGPDETIIDKRDILAGLGTDEREIFANQFAAALLMPAANVVSFNSRHYAVPDMARLFGTSTLAMELRLKNLGLT